MKLATAFYLVLCFLTCSCTQAELMYDSWFMPGYGADGHDIMMRSVRDTATSEVYEIPKSKVLSASLHDGRWVGVAESGTETVPINLYISSRGDSVSALLTSYLQQHEYGYTLAVVNLSGHTYLDSIYLDDQIGNSKNAPNTLRIKGRMVKIIDANEPHRVIHAIIASIRDSSFYFNSIGILYPVSEVSY